MPASFYGESSNQMTSALETPMVSCKSCYGTGIVWEMETAPYWKYDPSQPINPPPLNPPDEYPTISWSVGS